MKPASFKYLSPETLDEALSIKIEYGDDVKPLAGGQSLIPAMNFRIAQPSILVDLNKLKNLDYIREKDDELRIGAMTRQSAVEKSNVVKKASPLLHETMPHIAHPQIRNRGTFGGSLVHADPAAELPVVAVALDAKLRVQNSNGDRWVNAKEFFKGYFEVDMTQDEILVEVAIPKRPKRTGWSFQEVARRKGDYAMAGVATLVQLDAEGKCTKARMVFLNVGDGPVDATQAAESLHGKAIDLKSIEEAAAIASDTEINPFGNLHATVDFQRHLSKSLAMKTLHTASQRAVMNGNGKKK